MNLIKIGTFSKISGVSVKTIRYYHSIGLIIPCYIDSDSGYRYYNEDSVKRIREVIALKDMGFSLDEIKRFDEVQIVKKIANYEDMIVDIKNKIDGLKQLKDKIC